MCIIIYKEWKKKAPEKSMIETCWDNNPDGAGFMVIRRKSKTVEYHKGYMTLESFKTAISEAAISEEDASAYHFRIATSGGVNPAMTHPFEVSDKEGPLRNLHGKAQRVFMHNGIIGQGSPSLSDTALFVMKHMAHVKSIEKEQQDIAAETVGSRTLTFDSIEGVLETGTWFSDKDLKFSNQTYKYTRQMYSYYNDYRKPGTRSIYEDDYDDWGGAYKRSYAPETCAPYTLKGKLYRLNDVYDGWSDECYDDKGCGYGYSGSLYCPGCDFVTVCDRAATFITFGTLQERCSEGVELSERTNNKCNSCPLYVTCSKRTSPRHRRHHEWIHNKGYCIRVY